MSTKHAIFIQIIGAVATAVSASGAVELIHNPYESVDWNRVEHHKANFHAHTTVSDGTAAPHQMVDAYHEAGYTILALTDHDRVTYPWTEFNTFPKSVLARRSHEHGRIAELVPFENRSPDELGMIAVPGNEVSPADHDLLSLFSDFRRSGRTMRDALNEMADYPDNPIAAIAHPATHWHRDFGRRPGVEIPLDSRLRSVARGDFTFEAWFRVVDSSRSVLMGNHSPGEKGAINLKVQTWINEVRFTLRPEGEGETVDMLVSAAAGDVDLRRRAWHHVAGVRSGDIIHIYIDGQEIGRAPDRAGAFDLRGEVFLLVVTGVRGSPS